MNLKEIIRKRWETHQIHRAIRLMGLTLQAAQPVKLRPKPSILVVRLDRIGDVLLTTPLLGALKRRLDARITLAVSPYAADVMRGHSDVDELWVHEEGRSFDPSTSSGQALAQGRPIDLAQGRPIDLAQGRPFDLAQGRPIDLAQGRPIDLAQGRPIDLAQGRPIDLAQGRRFDVAIDPYVGFSYVSAHVCWKSQAPVRVGYESAFAPYFFTNWSPASEGYEAYRHLKFLDLLAGGESQKLELPSLKPGQEAEAFAERLWQDQQWKRGDRVVILNPGSRRSAHRWGEYRYAEVGKRLQGPRFIGVSWGPGERDLAARTAALIGKGASILPETTIRQLAAVYQRSSLVVCADSGPFHVAVSQCVPVVAVFGGSDANRWAPPSVDWIKILRAGHMAEVTPHQVTEACEIMLKVHRPVGVFS